MFDPKNLEALVISFGLTLWDAVPVFVIVATASAIVATALLQPKRFTQLWIRRRLFAPGGIAYLLLLQSELAIGLVILVVGATVSSVVLQQTSYQVLKDSSSLSLVANKLPCNQNTDSPIPSSVGQAVKLIVSEVFGLVLFASGVTALLKVYGTNLQIDTLYWILFAAVAGVLTGLPPGNAVIPAATITTISGSLFAGALWLGIAMMLELIRVIQMLNSGYRFRSSTPDQTHQSSD